MMRTAYEELASVYASSRSDEEKLAQKHRTLTRLESTLKLGVPVTNATLMEYRTYGAGQQQLSELFERCGRNFVRMLRRLEALRPASAVLPPHMDPSELLRSLANAECF